MARIVKTQLRADGGFFPSTATIGPNKATGTMRDGKNVLIVGPGLVISAKGQSTGPSPGVGGDRLYIVNNLISSVIGKGSVIMEKNMAAYLSVSGRVTVGGTTYNSTGGRLRYTVGGQERNVGLSAPTAPTLAMGGDGNINNQALSAKITRIRTSGFILGDGSLNIYAESNASPSSNVISLENKNVIINFPAVGTGLDAHDAWGVYLAPTGLGSTVDSQRFYKVVPTSSGNIEFSFDDNELTTIFPPVDNFPPPVGEYVGKLGNVTFVIGSRGGLYFSPSRPGFPEAYSPLSEGILPLSGPVNGFIGQPNEGELYIWSDNSIGSLTLSGSEGQPIYGRTLFPNVGILSAHGLCFAGNVLYGFTSDSSPSRLDPNGNMDQEFAIPVRDYIRSLGWNGRNVSVGFDPAMDMVVYCHGDTALAYNTSLDKWSPLTDINFNLGTAFTPTITYQGRLVLGRGDGLTYWESGITDLPWYIVPAFSDGREDGMDAYELKQLQGFRVNCDANSITMKLYINGADTEGTATDSLTSSGSGNRYTKWKRMNRSARNWTLRVEGQGANERLNDIQFMFLYTGGLSE